MDDFLTRLTQRFANRFVSRWLVLAIDLLLVFCCYVLALLTRLNFSLDEFAAQFLMGRALWVTTAYGIGFLLAQSFSGVVRHTGLHDALKVFRGVVWATVILLFVRWTAERIKLPQQHFLLVVQSTIAFLFTLSTLVLIGSRFVFKLVYHQLVRGRAAQMGLLGERQNVIIYGAGDAGVIARNGVSADKASGYRVIAFMDDEPGKQNRRLQGLRVYAPSAILESDFALENGVTVVILAIQNIDAERKAAIIEQCLEKGLQVKSIPPVERWINGEFSARQLRPVRIEDVLQRQEIRLDNDRVREALTDRVVMVTGAAGSIGSGLANQILHYKPARLILVDQAETPMYELEQELRKLPSDLQPALFFAMGDIRNERRMRSLFERFRPHYVFHAAAYKHVPLMEANVHEAVHVNVFGTQQLADLSLEYGVDRFVMVSTDKAVNPTNVMGASKRLAEIYTQSLSPNPDDSLQPDAGVERMGEDGASTKFITTRFGNVLGSNGSVLPLFRKQIADGGPITVTHPDITRYFMTIPEACSLVLEAGVMGTGGEIFVFDMGKSVRIVDVARKMIQLSGLELEKDIRIEFTGLRPGEKLFEELLASSENTLPTHHPKIMRAQVRRYPIGEVGANMKELKRLLFATDEATVVARMKVMVPEFVSNNSPFEVLDKNRFAGRTAKGITDKGITDKGSGVAGEAD
jgi:FlaA1/EpsC-like NDP-sugar epimerase